MTESNDPEGKKLSLKKWQPLELKKTIKSGQIKQSLSPLRSKTVTVEIKRKRVFDRDRSKRDGGGVDGLSEAERRKRTEALAGAAAEEARLRRSMEESSRTAETLLRRVRAEAEADAAEAEEQARALSVVAIAAEAVPSEVAAAASPQAAGASPVEAEAPTPRSASGGPRAAFDEAAVEDDKDKTDSSRRARPGRVADKKAAPPRAKADSRRRQGRLTIHQALDGTDESPRTRSLAALRRARDKEREQAKDLRARHEKIFRGVTIPEAITVSELSNRMAERIGDVIKALLKMGVMATPNHALDADTAELVVAEFGHRARRVAESDVEIGLDGNEDDPAVLRPRPPVVAVMGHVDHGKTSLLDALRHTNVRGGEDGGITQHIGAYQVTTASGAAITFLDTPGHEAFTRMRQRGAAVTDLVILVVAADDGLQPQTVEAINHARAAGTPILVAINKCDKPEADPQRVKTQLLQHGLVPDDLGGDVQCIEISALKKQNLDRLEEAILLQADLMELTANPDRPAMGSVIEARLEKGRGPVATVLVQRGALRVGDVFVGGSEWGRVRALLNDNGQSMDVVGPSCPVEVIGFQGVPQAGGAFAVLESDVRAREIADYRRRRQRDAAHALSSRRPDALEQMLNRIKGAEDAELAVVVKADVQGSLEAITTALQGIQATDARVRVLHGAVGAITESDVSLVAAAGGVVIGFNVRANPQGREQARRDGVDIRYYSVIYDLIDDVKSLLSGMLAPELRERFLGYADVREVFMVSKVGRIAGCLVTEGQARRGGRIRLLRDDIVVYEGALKTLRRFKDDVRDVQNGYECGIALEGYDGIKSGDRIECFEVDEVQRTL